MFNDDQNTFSICFEIIKNEKKFKIKFFRNLLFSFICAFLEILFVSIIFLLLNSFNLESNLIVRKESNSYFFR